MKPQFSTPEELQAALGDQVRKLRLIKNLMQAEVAARAAISPTAIKRLEAGKGATIGTLVAVLRALDRADWLTTLAPAVSISPMQLLATRSPRKRARARK